jgi:hypothetical protein
LAKSEEIGYDHGCVQALLVLTILQIDQGFLSQAWITIGKAVYTASLLNIIPSAELPSQPMVDDKQRRLFLGLFVLETLVAYALGKRPYLHISDFTKIGPLSVDSIEEWEPWRPLEVQQSSTGQRTHIPGRSLSTFNAFVDLVTLLNKQVHGLVGLEQTMESFQSWKTRQPSSHRNTIATIEGANTRTPPQMVNIILASLTVDATLQIKTVLAKESRPGPASFATISASAQQSLEAIISHARHITLPRTSCLMPLFMSIIKAQTNIHELPLARDEAQQPTAPTDEFPRPEASLDYFEMQTQPSSTLLVHSACPSARE